MPPFQLRRNADEWQSEVMAVGLSRNAVDPSKERLRNCGSSLGTIGVWKMVCVAHLLVTNEKIDKEEFTLLMDSTNIGEGE